jgi:hypothetical protein
MGISGRYEAQGRHPEHKREVLHLRVDVDQVSGGGPVTNWISGDIFVQNALDRQRGRHVFSWRMKVAPLEGNDKAIPRQVPFRSDGPATQLVSESDGFSVPVTVDINQKEGQTDFACTVTVTMSDGIHTFDGSRKGLEFRTLELGVAFCTGGFRHPDCDLTLAGPSERLRKLRLEKSFAEAGVALTQQPPVAVKDTSLSDGAEGWTTAELHASLEAQLAKLDRDSDWPRWFLCGLLADRHAEGDLGVMFDEESPNRQGFAVFQNHSVGPPFPKAGDFGPANTKALRLYFFTWMHEIGHGFNLQHSNLKSRPRALSWMNDDDALKSAHDFWEKFEFSFDAEELVHLRHGNWKEVVMGGLPLARGGHLRESSSILDCSPAVLDQSAPAPPVRVVLDHGGYFDLMRPVTIHVELQNGSDKGLPISTDLSPESGSLAVLIRRPDGRTVEYVPPVRRFRQHESATLAPRTSRGQLLHLMFGRDGFYFDNPGQYILRAVYVGQGTDFIVSNPLRIRVGFPPTATLDRLAQDFFAPDVGRCLYFGGSPYLDKALNLLTSLALSQLTHGDGNAKGSSLLGADIARVVADGIGKRFRYITADGTIKKIDGRPKDAVTLTQAALAAYESAGAPAKNPLYDQLRKTRNEWTNVAAGTVDWTESTAEDVARKMREHAAELVRKSRLRYPHLPW